MKKISALLIVFAVIFSFSAYSEEFEDIKDKVNMSKSATDAEAKEIYAVINKPTSQVELLKNLKIIIDNGLLLRKDFYTEKNINNFLDYFGKKITCINENDNQHFCAYFNQKAPTYMSDDISVSDNLPRSGEIYVFLNKTQLATYQDIVNIFGDRFIVVHEEFPDNRGWNMDAIAHGQTRKHFMFKKSLDEPILIAKQSPHKYVEIYYAFITNTNIRMRHFISFKINSEARIQEITVANHNDDGITRPLNLETHK